jgi:hypothetical protein
MVVFIGLNTTRRLKPPSAALRIRLSGVRLGSFRMPVAFLRSGKTSSRLPML